MCSLIWMDQSVGVQGTASQAVMAAPATAVADYLEVAIRVNQAVRRGQIADSPLEFFYEQPLLVGVFPPPDFT